MIEFMRKLILIGLILLSVSCFAQSKKHLFENKQIKIEYHTKNGLMDGKYISHYPNGKKKAEGHFKDNLRVGKWDVWDSTGKIHLEHTVKTDSLVKNVHGYFNYTYLKEAEVAVEKRVWRNASKENNPLLFYDTDLFDTLSNLIRKDSLVIFKDEEFQTTRSKEDIKEHFSDKYEIISYKIKEDWFMDKKTNASEVRPLGLYLILRPKNSEGEENMGLGWIYFPQIRKIFASQKIQDKHYPHITNLDEVFWYRHFTSQVYKELNVYDRSIASYAKTPEAAALEAERVEMDMIELEHDYWLFGDKIIFHWEPK